MIYIFLDEIYIMILGRRVVLWMLYDGGAIYYDVSAMGRCMDVV